MRKIKRITSIVLAALMVMSVFIAVPITASAVTQNDINVLLRQMDELAMEREQQDDYEAADALYMSSRVLEHQFRESENYATDPNVERAYNIALAVYNHFNGTGSVDVTSVSATEVDKLDEALMDLAYDYMMSDDYYNFKVLSSVEDILQEAYHAADGNSEDQNLLSAYSLASFILAQYTGTTDSYTVTWKNGDTTLETDTDVAADSTPTYNGTTPTKASDTYYDYTFSGWSPAIAPVSADVTYTAQYTATAKTFKVFAKKLTGGTYTIENLTGETTVAQLKEIIADQIDIPATAQRLIFAGKEIEDAKTLAEYNIQKESTIHVVAKTYTVTWLNYDNSELGTANVAYGATPTYDGTPERPEDANNTYTFAAWDNGTTTYVLGVDDLPPVTGDVTYTAVFTANPKHTVHTYTANPTFNWTQDASTGDWDCNTLTLTCTGCDLTQDYEVYAFSFGGGGKSSAVTCTANADGSYTYSVSKTVDGTKYEDSKTYNANGVVKSATQLKAAAKKGGSWELGNDIDQAVGISCADGFVLDGNNYTVTRHSNSATSAVFVAANKNASFTLNDLTIDGIANQTEVRPAIASAQSNPNSGNVINLNNVKIINWDFDQDNNGAVLAWGQATVNMTNCDIDTDSNYDVWGGAASTINVDGGKAGTVYLNGGTSSAALTNGAVVDNFATSSDNNIKDNGDGTYSVVPKVYVAQVGETKYESLTEAIEAAADGGTVKLLADQTIDLQVAAGEEYTIDLNSYTLTVESPQNYYNYIYGDLTIEDSSAAKTGKVVVDDYGIAPRAGGKVTVNGGTFTTADDYPYLIYLMGGELEVNGGTFTAVHPVNCYASGKTVLGGTVVINDGEFTSTEDYVISGFENSNITINGGSFTGPNPVFVGKASKKTSGFTPASATINGGTFIATDDTPVVGCAKGASVDIKGGTFEGALSADSNSEMAVSGGTFDQAVPEEYCANGYAPKDNGNGTYGVGPDTSSPLNPIEKAAADINDGNLFGINCDYLNGTLLGVQKKFTDKIDETTSSQEGDKNMRFVAVLDTDLVQDADDYGFVLAKANNTNKTYAEINYDAIKAGDDRVKTISAKGTYNNVCGNEAYGDPSNTTTDYKYITCAVNNVTDDDKVIARFYYKKDGKTYYAKYAGHNYQYTGCMAAWSELG